MAGEYKRLLEWSERTGDDVKVAKNGDSWIVSATMHDPLTYTSSSGGSSLDEAAAKVIGELEMVSSKSLEDHSKREWVV